MKHLIQIFRTHCGIDSQGIGDDETKWGVLIIWNRDCSRQNPSKCGLDGYWSTAAMANLSSDVVPVVIRTYEQVHLHRCLVSQQDSSSEGADTFIYSDQSIGLSKVGI